MQDFMNKKNLPGFTLDEFQILDHPLAVYELNHAAFRRYLPDFITVNLIELMTVLIICEAPKQMD